MITILFLPNKRKEKCWVLIRKSKTILKFVFVRFLKAIEIVMSKRTTGSVRYNKCVHYSRAPLQEFRLPQGLTLLILPPIVIYFHPTSLGLFRHASIHRIQLILFNFASSVAIYNILLTLNNCIAYTVEHIEMVLCCKLFYFLQQLIYLVVQTTNNWWESTETSEVFRTRGTKGTAQQNSLPITDLCWLAQRPL